MTTSSRLLEGAASFPLGKPDTPLPNTVSLGAGWKPPTEGERQLLAGLLPAPGSAPSHLRRRRPTFRGILRRLGGLLPRRPLLPSPSPRVE
ncbi:hypothetical protein [Aminiphilus sp.]|uniref:hypothetical protein n=1 Tax=Aminiphilus sp. TaxID=1872488 RepID=UPI002604F1E6|nr:hypothetical protein [Aminiphilus sp.]